MKDGRGNEEQDNGFDRVTIVVASSCDVGATGRQSDGPAKASDSVQSPSTT